MIFGYARVSARDQNIDTQIDALTRASCDRIFQEKISGTTTSRPALDEMLRLLRPGDTVVVARLDRLGRSSSHLIQLVTDWGKQDIQFRALDLGVDTATLAGRMILGVLAVLAEYDRGVIREKTSAGMSLAIAQGKRMGRPEGVDQEKYDKVKMACRSKLSVMDTVRLTGISESSVKRYRKMIEMESQPRQSQ